MKRDKIITFTVTQEDHKKLTSICHERYMTNGTRVTISDILREALLPYLSVSSKETHTEENLEPSKLPDTSNFDFGYLSDNGE